MMIHNFYRLLSQIPISLPSDSIPDAAQDLKALKSLSFDELINRMVSGLIEFAIHLAIAIVVFYAGKFIIKRLFTITATILHRRNVEQSLTTFVLSFIKILLYFILIITVIGILGINTSSFLAVFASVGVAIGMALSGTLQNFAGGVLILLLKPYKIGDYIEAQGYAGTVREIQIFSTIITTYDNKSISIPNGGLSTGSVNNWSREAYRRVTWTISISYGDSVDAAREAILAMFAADSRIEQGTPAADNGIEVVGDDTGARTADTDEEDLSDINPDQSSDPRPHRSLLDRILHRHRETKKAIDNWERRRQARIQALIPKPDYSPKVFVAEMGASSVDLQVRAWTRTGSYWDVFYYYNEKFYNELPSHGINFPFPQLDVHLSHTQAD